MSGVLLLKNKTEPRDPYESLFSGKGYSVDFVPLLCHVHESHDEIVSFLESSLEARAFIITSQRAVEALMKPLAELKTTKTEVYREIINKPMYTVGQATARLLSKIEFQDIRGGDEAGNGDVLANIIVSAPLFESGGKKIIFFTGETRRDIIPRALDKNGFDLTEKVVYKTESMGNIGRRFESAYNKLKSPIWIVFFSPQGTEQIIEYINNNRPNCKIASIGPTTESFLKKNGIRPDTVSAKPIPESLLESMK